MKSTSTKQTLIAAPLAWLTWVDLAHAEGAAGGSNPLASLVPLVLMFLIFYFLLIRPQQKRLKAHRAMIESLKKGDKIVTGGGIYGTVIDVKDGRVRVEIADGVRIMVKQDTIASLAD